MDTTVARESPHRSYLTARHVLAAVALLALLALAAFPFAAGLVAPGWAVVVLVGFGAAALVLGVVWFRRRPWGVVPLPVVAVLVGFGAVSAGQTWLGWTG